MRDSALYASFKTHLAAILAARPKASEDAPADPPSPAPSSADLQFDRVRASAIARIASEERASAKAVAARQAEARAVDATVAGVFDAMNRAGGLTSEAEADPAVRAILDSMRLVTTP